MAGIVATIAPSMLPQLPAQSPPAAFEVASVRQNTSGMMSMRLEPQPGGRLTGTNVTAAMLIRFAYDLPDFLVFGGPNWLNSDRFDLVAKAEADVPIDQKRLMLRRLLGERFRLTAQMELRQLPDLCVGDRQKGWAIRAPTSPIGSKLRWLVDSSLAGSRTQPGRRPTTVWLLRILSRT